MSIARGEEHCVRKEYSDRQEYSALISWPQYLVLGLEAAHIIVGVFGIPIRRIWKGGGLFPNILLCWGLFVLWGVVWCIGLPLILSPFGNDIVLLFPESYAVAAILVVGLLPCTLICSIAFGIIEYGIPVNERKEDDAV